jgi:hypothetical protein
MARSIGPETESLPPVSDADRKRQPFDIPGISLPIEILIHPAISKTEQILFGFIKNLAKNKNGCYAKNSYLAKLLGTSSQTVSNAISNMQRWGFLHVEFRGNSPDHRHIYINEMYGETYRELVEAWHDHIKGGAYKDVNIDLLKTYEGVIKKFIGGYKEIYSINRSKNLKEIKENDNSKDSDGKISKKKSPNYRIDLFEELYQNHPRPKSKDNVKGSRDAWIAQHNRKPDERDPRPPLTKHPDDLIRKVHAHCVKEVWDDPQYVPMFASWINSFEPKNYPELSPKQQSPSKDNGIMKALERLDLFRDHVLEGEWAREVRDQIRKVGPPGKFFSWVRKGIEEGTIEGSELGDIYPGPLFDAWVEEMEER